MGKGAKIAKDFSSPEIQRVQNSIALQASAVLAFPLAICMGPFVRFFAITVLAVFFYGGYRTMQALPQAERLPGDVPKLPAIRSSSYLLLTLMILLFILCLRYEPAPIITAPLALLLSVGFYGSLVTFSRSPRGWNGG